MILDDKISNGDLLPANGTTALVWFVYAQGTLQTTALTLNLIATGSMLTEVVESHQVKKGDQVAGLISSSRSFSRKVTSAVGTAIASWILVRIQFPTESTLGEVPSEAIRGLGLYFAPVVIIFGALAIASLFAYRITRAYHGQNLETLGLSQNPD